MAVTNASGGLNPEYAVGDITLLNDVCTNYRSVARVLTRHLAHLLSRFRWHASIAWPE
jgi:purine nucleoside phosphorylase